MSAAIKQDLERRRQAESLISELQTERQEVWSLYCHIAELKPFKDSEQTKTALKSFAEIMIDYVSLGHFGIYERLLAGTERRENVLTHAKQYYPEFSRTTDAVVEFNDRYDQLGRKLNTDKLETDLSNLGENLAKRMDIEDQLCNLLQN
jgi:regulator of sigma D